MLAVVTMTFQGCLLDVQAGACAGPGDLGRLVRRPLAGGAWLDVLPGWLRGADTLFERLVADVPWRAERRMMYDRMVAVPRLVCHYDAGEPLPDPALGEAMHALDDRYRGWLGEPLCTAGLCLYRDGRDSVAWHGDNSGRRVRETVVAILSLGAPRPFLLRPVAGIRAAEASGAGPASTTAEASGAAPASTTQRYLLGHGDLLVMGGTCQRTWQHAVPKTARAAGPRISVQFRPAGVR